MSNCSTFIGHVFDYWVLGPRFWRFLRLFCRAAVVMPGGLTLFLQVVFRKRDGFGFRV